jgi:uncharacterized repeat protein (TIGR01451 family)
VSFGPVNAATITNISPTEVRTVVPARAVTAPITVTTPDGNATSAMPFVIGPSADLVLVHTESADPVLQSQSLTYTLTVTNRGPSTGTGVVLSNILSPDVLFLSASVSQGTFARTGESIRASLGALASNAVATVTVTVLPVAAGSITNSGSVAATETDPNPADNLSMEGTTVTASSAVLDVQEVPGSQLRIAWPTAAANFVVQFKDALASSVPWQTLNAAPTNLGEQNVITVPIGPGTRYYRLMRP